MLWKKTRSVGDAKHHSHCCVIPEVDTKWLYISDEYLLYQAFISFWYHGENELSIHK